MISELQKWQSAEWTSTALDQDHARAWNTFYMAEFGLVMLLNGLVILGSLKSDKVHAELLANANSLLFFMLCVNNFLFGFFQALSRTLFVLAGYAWHELPCAINAAVNTLFLAASLLFLMAIALEQLASVVLLSRVPIDRIPHVIVGIYTSAGLWIVAQLAPPGRPVYTAGGEFCFSTSTGGWVGVANVLLVPVNLVTLIGTYMCIFVRLSRVFRASSRRRARAGKMGPGPVGKSLETVVAGRPAMESMERRSKDDREASVQRKFAIRGALALLNSSFLVRSSVPPYLIEAPSMSPLLTAAVWIVCSYLDCLSQLVPHWP
ncbi:hypothetical protein BCR44DRAFT_92421, partial [Catenaria anguillulae PL171]